jgi:hypothetical protein
MCISLLSSGSLNLKLYNFRRVDGLRSLISGAKATGAVKKFLPSVVTGNTLRAVAKLVNF